MLIQENCQILKGSTTLYYSIILTKKITCSIIAFLKLTMVKFCLAKTFDLPKNKKKLEDWYDYKIRAEAIIAYLKSPYKKYKKNKLIYSNYYVAHPIIRQIVFDKNKLLSL